MMTKNALAARIAWRYLRAPKSHSAVSAISLISVAGVAVATAAIVCVLSVFNGFRTFLSDRLDQLATDVLVTPAAGKTFADGDSLAAVIARIDGVELAMPSVVDNALAISDSREMPVTLRGVDPAVYSRITDVDSILLDGARLDTLGLHQTVISPGVARQLAVYETGTEMMIFAPRREGRVNLANPISSFLTDSVRVAGVFRANQSDYDENMIICDISTARNLFQYDSQATAVEVKAREGVSPQRLAESIASAVGPSAVVKDRLQQQEMNFRMISIEKWVTFLLLIFILMIASFNIISTLCMLIIEKQPSMSTLASMGMTRRDIGAVFRWESIYVSLVGGVAGIILGLVLSLAQQHFGLIKLAGDPDSLILQAYPVSVEWGDILIAMAPVAVVGAMTAAISARFARERARLSQA